MAGWLYKSGYPARTIASGFFQSVAWHHQGTMCGGRTASRKLMPALVRVLENKLIRAENRVEYRLARFQKQVATAPVFLHYATFHRAERFLERLLKNNPEIAMQWPYRQQFRVRFYPKQ